MSKNLKKIKQCFFIVLMSILAHNAFSQNGVAINTTGAAADGSSILDLSNNINKGLLLPQVISTSSVSSPAKGLVVFQTNAPAGIYCNTGTSTLPVWILLSSSTGTVTNVTASGVLSSSGGTTPNISLTGIVPIINGGTALSALGTPNQLLQVNAAGTALQYFTPPYLTTNQNITLTGDITGSGSTTIPTTLATVNSNVGTFNNVTVNAKGLVTAASNVGYQGALNGTGYVKQAGTITSYIPQIPLTTDVTGILSIANGGTNIGTLGALGSVIYSNGTQHVSTAVGTSGQVLTSAGAGVPTWTTPTNGTVTAVNGTAPIVSSGGNSPTISLQGTQGGVAYGTGTGSNFTAAGTAATQFLASNLTAAPTFRSITAADLPSLAGSYIQNQSATAQNPGAFNIAQSGTIGTTLNVGGLSTLSGGITGVGSINLNNNAGANTTNIGTGTTTGLVTIGGTGNNINLPKLTGSSVVLTDAAKNLISTTVLPISNGGTNGIATPIAGAIAYGTGTAYAFSTAGTAGQVLTSTGTGAPVWGNSTVGTIGQSNVSVYSSGALNFTTLANNTYFLVPGMTITLTVPVNSSLLITTAGGTLTTGDASLSWSNTQIGIYLDNVIIPNAEQNVISGYGDFYSSVPMISNWSFSAIATPSAASHTITVRALHTTASESSSDAIVGGPTSGTYSQLQGVLTVTVIKN